MRKAKHADKLGVLAGCTKRLMEESEYCGYKASKLRKRTKKKRKGEIFFADAWFASLLVAIMAYKMGHEFVGPVKTNKAGFPVNEVIEIMKEWPSGSNIVLKCKTPDGPTLICIGYKYSSSRPGESFLLLTIALSSSISRILIIGMWSVCSIYLNLFYILPYCNYM